MTKTLNLNFEDMFKISTTCLRFNRSHPDVVRDRVWKIQFCFVLTVSFTIFMLLLYSILLHDIKNGKFDNVCKNFTMVIVSITITLKYLVLLAHQESLKDMIKFLESDYNDDNYMDEDKDTVLEYAIRGTKVSKFWLYTGFVTGAIFPVKAFISMAYKYWEGDFKLVAMFEFTYPQPIEGYKNVPFIFCLLFLLALTFDFYAAVMYVGFDPIVPIFMLHICGQLVIISRRLNKLFAEVKDPKEIEEQLKVIVKKLQSLYNFMDQVKSNFSILYEYIMKATTFLIPLTAFQIIADLRNHWVNVEFISFFIGCILHFVIPCYYSDLLMETSENYRQAIYSCGWEKCPDKRVRQIILFMITRARIPLGIRTVFYEINLDTFAEMCRQSYTLLNLMNAAWA